MVPFIASYIFVFFDSTDAAHWHSLNNITGTQGFLGGEYPWKVKPAELAVLRESVGDDGALSVNVKKLFRRFSAGDAIKLKDGPFAGQNGVCETCDDDDLLLGVKISLLGREIVVYTPSAWCDPDLSENSAIGRSPPKNRRKQRAKQPGGLDRTPITA